MVEAVLAGVRLDAQWVGPPAQPGEVVSVELDIDDMLRWGDTIALAGGESTLREGPRLLGTVEHHEEHLLTLRIADGLLLAELRDGWRGSPGRRRGPVDMRSGTAVVVVPAHLKLFPTGS
jgi:hypothetical protein